MIPILAGIEYAKMTGFQWHDWLISILIIVGIYFLLQFHLSYNWLVLLAICICNILLIVNLFLAKPIIQHTSLKALLAGMYICVPFLVAYLTELHSNSFILLIAIMILIWVSDSAAYFVGSQIGKRKLFPSISPKKTWEGFYGAGMCVFVFAYIIFSLSNSMDLRFWIVFALIIWVLGALGDLVASHVKRLHSIKDSGSLLPGHGGFYDRFDAFIFVLPFILLLNYAWSS